MRREYLERITIRLPAACSRVMLRLVTLIGPSLLRSGDTFTAPLSDERFLPSISLSAGSDERIAKADCRFQIFWPHRFQKFWPLQGGPEWRKNTSQEDRSEDRIGSRAVVPPLN